MRTLAVIPARYASTRFPGKPLATIGGKPMLRHVWEKVTRSGLFEKVIVATDDERIRQAAESWGAEVVMTSASHPSGTDRCAEVLEKSGFEAEAVVNIQGDEPFIEKEPLQQLLRLLAKEATQIATLYSFLDVQESAANPNLVKLVTDVNGKALYFSRSPIPFPRNQVEGSDLRYKKHIGIYGYLAMKPGMQTFSSAVNSGRRW